MVGSLKRYVCEPCRGKGLIWITDPETGKHEQIHCRHCISLGLPTAVMVQTNRSDMVEGRLSVPPSGIMRIP
jgi:hypothetical protein